MRRATCYYKHSISFKLLSCLIAATFLITSLINPSISFAQTINTPVFMPSVGSMVNTSESFTPLMIRGITFNNENPLEFSFFVEKGNIDFDQEQLREESQRLINYFMAALTVPEKELWVNLSPYESERVVPESLGQTAMGRDLLAQDYLLKQFTASLMYPESELGEQFWAEVTQKVHALYGDDVEIPTDVYNKVWIMPESATIYVHQQSVFLTQSHLKVMLEEDYLAYRDNNELTKEQSPNGEVKEIIKSVILPEIEKEVNAGKNFAPLRQIFQSVILASWYKTNLQQTLFNQVYSDQNKVKGIDENDEAVNQTIYERYLEAFNTGVYNYIKEEYDFSRQQMMPKKYFSGGVIHNSTELFTNRASQEYGEYNQDLPESEASNLRPQLDVANLFQVRVQALQNVRSYKELWEDMLREPKKGGNTWIFQRMLQEDQNKFAQIPGWNNNAVWLGEYYDQRLLIQNLKGVLSDQEKREFDSWLVLSQTAPDEEKNEYLSKINDKLNEIADRYIGNSPNGEREVYIGDRSITINREGFSNLSIDQKFHVIRGFSTLNMVAVYISDLIRWDVFTDQEEEQLMKAFLAVVNKDDNQILSDAEGDLRRQIGYVISRITGNLNVAVNINDYAFGISFNAAKQMTIETVEPKLEDSPRLPILALVKTIHRIHPTTRSVYPLSESEETDTVQVVGTNQPEQQSIASREAEGSNINPNPVGGIDLNLEGMTLQIEKDPSGIPLPIDQQPFTNMEIEGFLPVIINITPVTNLPLTLGLVEDNDLHNTAKL